MNEFYFSNHAALTPQIMTSLYLYGTDKPPESAAQAFLLSRPGRAVPVITIDMADYMKNGGGRFANPSYAKFVRDFYEKKISLPDGEYTKEKLTQNHGFSKHDFSFPLFQEFHESKSKDYASRVYIFGKGGFTISEKTKFIIKDGKRYTLDMSVRPLDENFDFTSDKDSHQWLDEKILKSTIDPSGIGKRIEIEFREREKEKVPVKPKYEFADYLWDRADSIMPDINVTKGIPSAMRRTMDMLPLIKIYPSIENLTENDIRILMNSEAYRTSSHPDQEAVHALVAGWFERKYNGPIKKPALPRNKTGPVHVRPHTREGGREKVKAHDRARPTRRNRASE